MRARVALSKSAHKKEQSSTVVAQSCNNTCNNVLRTRSSPL